MALMSSRVVLACAIPTLIVVLGILWYKKKTSAAATASRRQRRAVLDVPPSVAQDSDSVVDDTPYSSPEELPTCTSPQLRSRSEVGQGDSIEVSTVIEEHQYSEIPPPVTNTENQRPNSPEMKLTNETTTPAEHQHSATMLIGEPSMNNDERKTNGYGKGCSLTYEQAELGPRNSYHQVTVTTDVGDGDSIKQKVHTVTHSETVANIEVVRPLEQDSSDSVSSDLTPEDSIETTRRNSEHEEGELVQRLNDVSLETTPSMDSPSAQTEETAEENSSSPTLSSPSLPSLPAEEEDQHRVTSGAETGAISKKRTESGASVNGTGTEGTSAYGSASHSPTDDMLESTAASNCSDSRSEGSSDSGKGGSTIHTPNQEGNTNPVSNLPMIPMQVYEFEIPQTLCGRLIGQHGKNVNYIKEKTRANISIKRHPFNPLLKLCAVIGSNEDIKEALQLIRKRFPLSKFPMMTLAQVNGPIPTGFPVPETLQLHLPEAITCDVILSSMVTAGHFFLQQPTHPTYPSLCRLDQCMLTCYMQGNTTPELPKPVDAGIICTAPMLGGWYRAQIVSSMPDTDECDIKFVDYGGYSRVPTSSLRQIRSDFMTLPFQAAECYLANVEPVDDSKVWPVDACAAFEELAQGVILQAVVVSYSQQDIPYVNLFRVQGIVSTFINRELVNRGFARWVDNQQ